MANVRKGRVGKKVRQESAQIRIEERAKQSNEQQLALLAKRPGSSKREAAKLAK